MDLEKCPGIKQFWDYEKNTISPESIPSRSNKTIYLKCPKCGYQWSTTVANRERSSDKCPCCELNQVVVKGINDLFTLVPGLKEEYDFEANKERTYNIYEQGSYTKEKAFFHCKICDRKWEARLKSRFHKKGDSYVFKPCTHGKIKLRTPKDIPKVSDIPELMLFWNEEKNEADASAILSSSNAKLWWKCQNCGYEWISSPRTRVKSSSQCPCCERNQVRMKGVNDLFTVIPEAKDYYDFEKNEKIDIYSMAIKDKKTKICWKCPTCSYEWESILANRIAGSEGNYRFKGCKRCCSQAQKKMISSVPALMKFWDAEKNTIDPSKESIQSSEYAFWKCQNCGYESYVQIRCRYANGSCPCCEGNMRVSAGYNDILTLFPEVKSFYDEEDNPRLDLREQSPFSHARANFHCKTCNYHWSAILCTQFKKHNNVLSFTGCPSCKGFRRTQTYAEQYPALITLFNESRNGMSFHEVTGSRENTRKKFWWVCSKCGNDFRSELRTMLNGLSTSTGGCPYCNKILIAPETSFAGIHPELLEEYSEKNTINPYEVFPSSDKSVIWVCNKHGTPVEWTAHFRTRHNQLGGCPVCNHTSPIKGFNTFADVYPEQSKRFAQNNSFRLDEVMDTASEWGHWICSECGGEYGAYTYEIADGTDACPYCEGHRALKGFNTLQDIHPEIAALMSDQNELRADAITVNWSKRLLWECPTCHGIHSHFISEMLDNPQKCPYCENYRVLPGYNSLDVTYPKIMPRWSKNNIIDPSNVLATSKRLYLWYCSNPECPGDYNATIDDILNDADTCPYCEGKRVYPGYNSFDVNHPDIMKEYDYISNYILTEPNAFGDNCKTTLWWICAKNSDHNYPMSPVDRLMFQKRHREPCPYCRGKVRNRNYLLRYKE